MLRRAIFFSYKYTTTSREEGGASLCITVCIRNRICIRIYKNGRIKSLWRLPEEVIEGKSEILIWEWYTQMTNGNATSTNQVNIGHQVIKVDIYYTLNISPHNIKNFIFDSRIPREQYFIID